MYNIFVLETSNYMCNRIHFPDMCKKLITKSFSLACVSHKTCNIYKFNCCGNYFRGFKNLC